MTEKLVDGRRVRSWARAALVVATVAVSAARANAQVRPGGGGFGGGSRPPVAAEDGLAFHVLSRVTYGADPQSLAEIRRLGVDAFIWRQLHPQLLDDSALEAQLALDVLPVDDPLYQWKHFYYDHLARARYSQRQLQEVMTQFWENHFDTVVPRGNNDVEAHTYTLWEQRENAAFRAGALGRFRDLLEVSAKSQAMMFFLDNYFNNVRSGNENYARELLELHTLGVDCGYTQADVQEVARIWTGWSGIDLVRDPTDPRLVIEGDFAFNAPAHDFGAKLALGEVFPAGGGLEEGERVLDILSRHPCTARFVATKLLQAFVTDAPSEQLVDRIAGVFLDTDGDILRVLDAMFAGPEFRDPAHFGGKVKTPLEFTMSVLRATEAVLQRTSTGRDNDYLETYWAIYGQGMGLFDMAIPTGFAEVGGPWISSNGFLQRWKYADRLMFSAPAATRPVSTDPGAVVARLGFRTADEIIDHFSRVLVGMPLSHPRMAGRRDLLRTVLLQGAPEYDPVGAGQDARLREMVAQLIGFPEFNEQ